MGERSMGSCWLSLLQSACLLPDGTSGYPAPRWEKLWQLEPLFQGLHCCQFSWMQDNFENGISVFFVHRKDYLSRDLGLMPLRGRWTVSRAPLLVHPPCPTALL